MRSLSTKQTTSQKIASECGFTALFSPYYSYPWVESSFSGKATSFNFNNTKAMLCSSKSGEVPAT